MKWRMSVIDNCRATYEHSADQFAAKCFPNLPPTFDSWFTTTVLHLYIIQKRLLMEGPIGKDFNAELLNHLWLDIEIKLHQAGVRFIDTG
jgi:hypothetical protein